MKTLANLTTHRAWMSIQLPAALLIALLQRSPVVRLIEATDEFVTASPVGALLRSTVAAAASLGTLHSLAGATTLFASSASPVTVTAGSAVAPIAFTVTNTINIASWKIGGTLPPGMSLAATQGGASLTGPGVLDATTPGMDDGYGGMTGGITSTTPFLGGTPTQPGLYTFTLQAFEFANLTGLASNTFSYSINISGSAPTAVAPTVTAQPASRAVSAGTGTSLSVTATVASGGAAPTFQWQRNGSDLSGATNATLTLDSVQPANAGLYTAVIASGATTTSDPAIVGVTTTDKVIGAGTEVQHGVFVASNGNTFDQVLVTGAAEAITADTVLRKITRTSFIDLNNDIVQVEFSGPGTLSLVLDNPSGPAVPVNYNQSVTYMKGHAGIVITGATKDTNLAVFSVGRITAVNQALFKSDVTYDGLADIAFIAISSTDGQFGAVRTADASYFATKGLTGLYAPGVQFAGPIFLGDISASDAATPMIVIGSVTGETRITGGDLLQANGRAVQVSGLTQLKFTAGQDSHGNPLSAKVNRAILQQNGADVTTQIVVNSSP